MTFLVDRCAGRRLTQSLQSQGHDALDARELGPDPGDRALLEQGTTGTGHYWNRALLEQGTTGTGHYWNRALLEQGTTGTGHYWNRALLEQAVSENRILITMDKDFGELIHLHGRPHTGLIRLPDVRMAQRITLVEDLILNHRQALDERAIITVTNSRIRISRQQLR